MLGATTDCRRAAQRSVRFDERVGSHSVITCDTCFSNQFNYMCAIRKIVGSPAPHPAPVRLAKLRARARCPPVGSAGCLVFRSLQPVRVGLCPICFQLHPKTSELSEVMQSLLHGHTRAHRLTHRAHLFLHSKSIFSYSTRLSFEEQRHLFVAYASDGCICECVLIRTSISGKLLHKAYTQSFRVDLNLNWKRGFLPTIVHEVQGKLCFEVNV